MCLDLVSLRTRAVNFELLSLCSPLKGLSVFLSESQSLPDDFGNLWYTCSPVVVYFQLMPEQIVAADGWVAVKTGVLAYVKYPERSKFGSSFALSYTYCLAGCQVYHWNSLCRPIGLVQGGGGGGQWDVGVVWRAGKQKRCDGKIIFQVGITVRGTGRPSALALIIHLTWCAHCLCATSWLVSRRSYLSCSRTDCKPKGRSLCIFTLLRRAVGQNSLLRLSTTQTSWCWAGAIRTVIRLICLSMCLEWRLTRETHWR